jgi:hypothetical protein
VLTYKCLIYIYAYIHTYIPAHTKLYPYYFVLDSEGGLVRKAPVADFSLHIFDQQIWSKILANPFISLLVHMFIYVCVCVYYIYIYIYIYIYVIPIYSTFYGAQWTRVVESCGWSRAGKTFQTPWCQSGSVQFLCRQQAIYKSAYVYFIKWDKMSFHFIKYMYTYAYHNI